MKELVLASGNLGKLDELQCALKPLNLKLRPISQWTQESPEETATSFAGNALIKARHAAQLSGLPSLADDSGLCVDALEGGPGVYSARYAGPDATDAQNNAKLLAALDGVDEPLRTARFVCVIALVRDAQDSDPILACGQWNGQILRQPRGQQGFGYDPLFLDPELGRCAAELDRQTKLAHSHRGRAIATLIRQLRDQPL